MCNSFKECLEDQGYSEFSLVDLLLNKLMSEDERIKYAYDSDVSTRDSAKSIEEFIKSLIEDLEEFYKNNIVLFEEYDLMDCVSDYFFKSEDVKYRISEFGELCEYYEEKQMDIWKKDREDQLRDYWRSVL